jgi:hypothetical protein
MLTAVSEVAASSAIDKLRAVGTPRPRVDPELAGGLREWLEDSLADHVNRLGSQGRALRIDRKALRTPVATGSDPISRSNVAAAPHDAVLRALARSLFRQWTTTGSIEDPITDAISGQAASGDPGAALQLLSLMSDDERRLLFEDLRMHATRIAATWPALSPAWFPRSHERLTIPLCGGRVVLFGIADLVIGAQASIEASVCVVGVESERRGAEPRTHLHFLALLETLRAGAAPSRVATYYTRTGELDAEPVDEHLLVSALLRVVAGVEELCTGRQLSGTPQGESSEALDAPAGAPR